MISAPSLLAVTSPPNGVVILKNAVSFYFQRRLLRIFEEFLDVTESVQQLRPLVSQHCRGKEAQMRSLISRTEQTLTARKKLLRDVLDQFYRLTNENIETKSKKMLEDFGRRETAREYKSQIGRECPTVLDYLD